MVGPSHFFVRMLAQLFPIIPSSDYIKVWSFTSYLGGKSLALINKINQKQYFRNNKDYSQDRNKDFLYLSQKNLSK